MNNAGAGIAPTHYSVCIVHYSLFIAAPAAQPAASAGGGQPPLLTFYFLLLDPQGRAGRSHRRRRLAILDRICVLRWLQARDKSFGLKSRRAAAPPGEGLLAAFAPLRRLRPAATKAIASHFQFSTFNFQFPPLAYSYLWLRRRYSVSAETNLAGARLFVSLAAPKILSLGRNKPCGRSTFRIFGCAEDTQSRQCSNKFGFRALDYTYLWLRPRYSRSAETNLAVCFCARLFVSLSPENAKTRKR